MQNLIQTPVESSQCSSDQYTTLQQTIVEQPDHVKIQRFHQH